MILGVGSDIIHIPRIAKAIENPRFAARVYTAGEIAYARGRGAGAAASFAARFAGKEAVMKAFGTGLRNGTLLDIEITGAFAVRAAAMSVTRVWITLSHEKEYATAYCVLEGSL